MIVFAYPIAFLLLLIPFLIYFLTPAIKGMHGEALRVPFISDLKRISIVDGGIWNSANSNSKLSKNFWLLYFIWFLLVLSCARPQMVGEPMRLKQEARDIMLVLDISTSMLEDDFSLYNRRITRLDAVKNVVSEFVDKRSNDRIGLILFGTRAYLQSPLTFDKASVVNILQNADAGMAGNSTSIGDALGLALKNIKEEKDKSNKVIILLSDGESNDGYLSMAEAITLAEKEGIKIYTIGVGSDVSFIGSIFGIKNNELDETSLKELAQRTKGNYFRATDLTSLEKIYEKIDTLEPKNNEGNIVQEKIDLFYLPLALALFLSIFLIFLPRSMLK